MKSSRRRIQEELRMVEKQLPLYYRKIRELERRQQELYSHLKEEDRFSTKSTVTCGNDLCGLDSGKIEALRKSIDEIWTAAKDKKEADRPASTLYSNPRIKPLGATAKNNVLKLLEEARKKFDLLGDGVNQALNYIDTMNLVLNLVEYSGGELHQNLIQTASLIQQQVEKTPDQTVSNHQSSDLVKTYQYTDQSKEAKPNHEHISAETIAEIMKSPLFQQLAAQLKKSELNSN
ncbi:MAG: hypothetical protein GX295_03020 [Syntrophomonadaceae bacterium]|nr:hypothetical protein [Syntrophomonadaceae bacterium]